jgi:hypothetical protein
MFRLFGLTIPVIVKTQATIGNIRSSKTAKEGDLIAKHWVELFTGGHSALSDTSR